MAKAEVSQEDFTIEVECPAPVFVYADPFRIGQVVTILIKMQFVTRIPARN